MSNHSIILADDSTYEFQVSTDLYHEAKKAGISVPQLINRMAPDTNDKVNGSAFEQLMTSSGLLRSASSQMGFRPPSVKEAMDGTAEMMALGKIQAAGDGNAISKDNAPASRILFPIVAIEATEGALRDNNEGFVGLFNQLVSRTEIINGEKFEQPIINYGAIDADPPRPMPIAQGAMPHGMPVITASDIIRRIPHYAMGLEITDQAQAITSLPLVTTVLQRQAEHYRYQVVLDTIGTMLNGDLDNGFGALPVTNMSTFDGTLAPGQISQLAWIKFLMNKYRRRQIDWVLGDFDTAYKIEQRMGKPTQFSDDPTSPRIDAMSKIVNPQWNDVSLLMVPDGVVPADTIFAMDTRYAMWHVISSSVNYQAIEEFVLRRVTGFRWDMGFMYLRQFDDAFDVAFLA